MRKEPSVEENSYFWKGDLKLIEPSYEPDYEKPIHIDLFSGCGGFSSGFEEAGFQTLIANDIHPQSLQTLTHNIKGSFGILGDVKKLEEKSIKKIIGKRKVSVITAGVPCQGFSLSNKKRFADDPRNFLFKEFLRISEFLKPDAVILENVTGLVSTKNGFFKEKIQSEIEKIGYKVSFKMLNSFDYGIPQVRKRVFFVGVKKNNWLFPYPVEEKRRTTVGDAIIGDLPKLNSNEKKDEYLKKAQNSLQRKLRSKKRILENHKAPNHPKDTTEKIRNTPPGSPMYPNFPQRIRLDVSRPSPTQVCGGIRPQFQFGHPTQPRGLSIRERARIQTFKDDFVFFGGLCQERIQTGNAVPPLLSSILAEQLFKLLSGSKIVGISDIRQLDMEFR